MIDVSAKINQARAQFESGKPEQARALLERALRQNPGHPDLANAMSLVLLAMGRLDLALYHAEKAVQGRPKDAGFQQNLGNALAQLSRGEEAEQAFNRALSLDPRATGARLGLSHALRHRYRFAEATDHLREALKTQPGDPDFLGALGPLLLKQANVEEAVEVLEQGLARRPGDCGCAAGLAHCLNYLPEADPARVLAAHRTMGQAYAAQRPTRWTIFPNTREPDRRLRIGLLSGDFLQHAIAFFIEPFLTHHDRASLEVICYSTGTREDEVTARLKKLAAGWKDLKAASFEARAKAIREDKVDVLIDLAGNVAGHNIPALVMKPAPVQANYLGYPATTGLAEIDYRIVDSLTDPAGSDSHACEKLVRIDPSFLCYRPPDDPPDVGPARPTGPITFGSFNSAPKINRAVIAAWARLLNQTPGSRLLLKALEFYDEALSPDVLRRFDAAGVDPARIQVHRVKWTFREHLETYRDIDIALDPFPYNGTTTSFESLFMGVPVVTLRGDRHVSRVSAAILTNLGLPEFIAAGEDDYISIAKSLADEPARRAELRSTLRPRLLASTLCDGPVLASRLSAAIRTMWREWCSRPG